MPVSNDSVSRDALVPQVFHPSKVMIIEAIRWIDEPMSAKDLCEVLDGKIDLSTVSYHLKTLDKMDRATAARGVA